MESEEVEVDCQEVVNTLNDLLGETIPTIGLLDQLISQYEEEEAELAAALEASSKWDEDHTAGSLT
jgi:hypothetical protein